MHDCYTRVRVRVFSLADLCFEGDGRNLRLGPGEALRRAVSSSTQGITATEGRRGELSDRAVFKRLLEILPAMVVVDDDCVLIGVSAVFERDRILFERHGVVGTGEDGIVGKFVPGEFSRLLRLVFRFLLVRLLTSSQVLEDESLHPESETLDKSFGSIINEETEFDLLRLVVSGLFA